MRRIYISVVLALLVSLIPTSKVNAQVLDFGGTVLNNDIASWMDIYDLSHTSNNYGTARSMAMGNAFTALGADMVSASLNPAGIGMYLAGDSSFTPMITSAKSSTTGEKYYVTDDGVSSRTTNFAVPNFGIVVPVSMSAGLFTNINFAVACNRIADFNQNRLMASPGHGYDSSLANYFRLFSDAFSSDLVFNDDGVLDYGNDPFLWGAALANRADLTAKRDGEWMNNTIYDGVVVDQYSLLETYGAVDEWSFAGGFNIMDKLYLGISVGLQSLSYTRNTYYGEGYSYAEGDTGMESQLLATNYWQSTYYYGSGYNFKFGVTARPVHWLRLGLAYHTPTYYSLEIGYAGAMQTETSYINPDSGKEDIILDYEESDFFEEYGMNAWQYHTPSRLLAGVAVTLGKRAIISADYERSWYQGLRLTNSTIRGLDNVYYDYFTEDFKANNTLRLGAECYVLPIVALRAGYIWSDSAIKGDYEYAMTSRPSPTTQSFITAGLGIQMNRTTYLDFAYQHGTTHYTSMQPFYITATEDGVTKPFVDSALFDTKTTRHNFVLTLGFRF